MEVISDKTFALSPSHISNINALQAQASCQISLFLHRCILLLFIGSTKLA